MITLAKRKSSWEIRDKLPSVQSQWSLTDALSATEHDGMCEVLPIREAHIKPWGPWF